VQVRSDRAVLLTLIPGMVGPSASEAVRAAVHGESLISPSVTVRLLEHLAAGGPVGSGTTDRLTEQELYTINTHLSKLFNANFGSMFRTDGVPTLFAFTMLRYVDLYMSDVSHLLSYDPSHRFYPHHAMHMVSYLDDDGDEMLLL
jgi:hypothetical protein